MFHLSDAVEVPQFKEYKQPEKVWELVHRHGLDLQFVESVLMDNRCVDKSVREQLSRGKAVLASAPVGGLQGRTRTWLPFRQLRYIMTPWAAPTRRGAFSKRAKASY
jgi:hypothetical protein